MKLNWGYGIAIFYGLFMLVLLFFVIKSTTHDNSLVVDNYYEKDLQYQEHYEKLQNANQLAQSVELKYDPEAQLVRLTFPKTMDAAKGTVHFFHPSKQDLDMVKPIRLDDLYQMEVVTKNLAPGRWKVKMDWENAGKKYYKETEVIL